MKFPRNAQIFRGQLDASPFVGVLFLLTMFLLLHSTLVSIPGVSIDLPTAPGELDGSTKAEVMIAVDRSGRLFFQSQLTEESRLKEQLVRLRAEPVAVVLLADKSLPNETLMRLLTLVHEAGISDVRWAIRSSAQPAANPRRP
jgi:biopolymer transport protein ExbD